MTKKKKGRGGKTSSAQLKKIIISFLSSKPNKRYNAKQLIRKLKLNASKDAVHHALEQLEQEGVLYKIADDKFKWDIKNLNTKNTSIPVKKLEGRVDLIRSGAAYIITPDSEVDIYVPAKFTMGAYDGDTVQVTVPMVSGRRKPEGKITKIIQRKTTQVLGKLKIFPKYGSVLPISEKKFPEVHIAIRDLGDVEDNAYVVADITDWGVNQNKAIWGKISKVLEEASENDIAMQSIVFSTGFEIGFPPEVIAECEKISHTITEEEINKRRDFRGVATFTIDPLTAKDFDDALSVEYFEDGSMEVGVHIADVTHYMKKGTALDKEAFDRSTSVYLVDRVIPMLPEVLSNDLCSLNPEEDKLVFTVAIKFNKDFRVMDKWIGRSVIHSDKRFTYEEAQEILEGSNGPFSKELLDLNRLAHRLRKKRYKYGSIAFESKEVYFELDDQAKPIAVHSKERKDAHMLVEDFMLLANRVVAQYIAKKSKAEIPFVYRVHDVPDPDRLADFAAFARELGIDIKVDTPKNVAKSLNAMSEMAEENPLVKLLEPLAIRTMAKAIYTTDNIGHYGLAFDYYSHFTSPIRRYADVLVHRILFDNLTQETRVKKEDLEIKCNHISSQERKATEAERASIKYKQVEYMMGREGEEFSGYVSGIIDRGLFILMEPSHAEGMVSFAQMDEPYVIPESRLWAEGKRSGQKIKMGQHVKVKVLEVNLDLKQIELELIEVVDIQ